ncbi:MAG: HAMP domain-containing protein [Planctomycetes bacterium]|nr:HAMP domain-containing protein [Planctomycetota bacterium]
MSPDLSRKRRRSISVRAKMLVVLVPLLLLIGVLLAYATEQAGRIHRDLARLTEEEHEAEQTQSLLVELRGAEAWAKRSIGSEPRAAIQDDLQQHLSLARQVLTDLHHPEEDDPSDPGHEQREHELRDSLLETLDRISQRVGDVADWSVFATDLGDARRRVEVLATETRHEATRVASHLDASVQRLVDMLFLLAAAGIATLVSMSWMFRRVVMHPLLTIEAATQSLGRVTPAMDSTAVPERPAARVPILSRDEFGQLAATFNDMAERIDSDRRELEQRVEQRTREVIRTARLAELGTLAAGIAHEINNPLASIAAGIEGLQRDLDGSASESSKEFLELVLEETNRARDIATRLLRLGRHDTLRREPVFLAHEVHDVAKMVGHLAKQRRVEVVVDVDEDLPPLTSDPGEWRQVLFNLLRNAIDATPEGTQVLVSAALENGRVVVRVRDHGPGFDDDDLDRVFEPFFTKKAPNQGTGLGLAIVDRIVREFGGEVDARNCATGGELRVSVPVPE